MLFIAILLILGLVYQFNDAFRQYLNAWFRSDDGGYLFCLIQNGYLPGESENCPLPQFNLQNGKKIAGGLGGTGAASGSGGNSGGSGGNSGGGSGGLGSFNSGGRVREGGSSLVPANIKGVGAQNGQGGAGTGGSTGDTGFSSSGSVIANNRGFGSRPSRSGGRYVPTDSADDETTPQSKSKNQTIPATERDLKAARVVAAENARRKRLQEQDLDTTISFGNVFKYAAIFAIIFALIFFIGSMLVAISRGGRKRD